MPSTIRQTLRRHLPYAARVELARLRRLPTWLTELPRIARHRAHWADRTLEMHTLAQHTTPLRRKAAVAYGERLQAGKEHNIALVVRLLDRLLIRPGEIFSYHHAVGRPSRLRGFVPGLEIHDATPVAGIGGGACAVSNLIYLLAINAGMRIIERHRHALDLFPDDGRTVPFGCGATVFYNLADLRFENPWPDPVVLRLAVRDGELRGSVAAARDPGFGIQIYEVGHRFFRDAESNIWRENQIRRRIRNPDGTVLVDEEIAHNLGRVVYPLPPGTAVEGQP